MAEAVIEVKPVLEMWQVTYNGSLTACTATRWSAVNSVARLLRQQLRQPDGAAGLTFVGLELSEVLASPVMNPNRRRKGPRIELELFERAEAYLQMEIVSPEETDLIEGYRSAFANERWGEALNHLVELGELQGCTNPFWKALEPLAEAVWSTKFSVDRRAKGQREGKVEMIKKRARGRDA